MIKNTCKRDYKMYNKCNRKIGATGLTVEFNFMAFINSFVKYSKKSYFK
jgi:hypothetical protein